MYVATRDIQHGAKLIKKGEEFPNAKTESCFHTLRKLNYIKWVQPKASEEKPKAKTTRKTTKKTTRKTGRSAGR